jgi:hypothetical protein
LAVTYLKSAIPLDGGGCTADPCRSRRIRGSVSLTTGSRREARANRRDGLRTDRSPCLAAGNSRASPKPVVSGVEKLIIGRTEPAEGNPRVKDRTR